MPCGVALILVAATWAVASPADGCNKALCASDVSKCLLQEVCQCEANHAGCPCCQECAFCLGNLWESCCECVGLCDERPASAPRSAHNDPPVGWSILTLPVEEELRQNHADTSHLLLGPHTGLTPSDAKGLNTTAPPCQAIFFNECLSMSRCRAACQSVGAWRYRWFHNACCQCLGPDCRGYGGAQAQCSNCRE
ncbi:twisted gastrulation protein homolog 1-B-like isoform X2 [Sphaerodactylus townsendi]|uniref:twisted gastrulation protein homolog 1-B-like isoform X2 n=1 Tax=Sphaerodactylus townsendi TaxID=933632 RepID=UPI002025BC32|nr:twisted gastrulation protein homolog 1-B-like isoform X2 [Sphaerodactylus townsendi]